MVNIYSDIYNLYITCSRLFGLYLQIKTQIIFQLLCSLTWVATIIHRQVMD